MLYKNIPDSNEKEISMRKKDPVPPLEKRIARQVAIEIAKKTGNVIESRPFDKDSTYDLTSFCDTPEALRSLTKQTGFKKGEEVKVVGKNPRAFEGSTGVVVGTHALNQEWVAVAFSPEDVERNRKKAEYLDRENLAHLTFD